MAALAIVLACLLVTSLAVTTIEESSIAWFPCPPSASIDNSSDAGVPLSCGTLRVPRDYSDSANHRTIELQLTKVKATKQPSKGSIILNPGGPGTPGADIFQQGPAEAILLLTGSEHDLIAFNPRGTGQTLPFSCFASDEDRKAAKLLMPMSLGEREANLAKVWAANDAFAQTCYDNAHDIGDLIGTAYTARDIMQIVDALGEDGLLRYWGFSYGTVLGATVAAMFPDRIDRMVLDGNRGIHDYYSGTALKNLLLDDEVLAGFFAGCLEAPHLCPLASNGTSAAALQSQTLDLLNKLGKEPVPSPAALPHSLFIDYAALQSFLYSMLWFPTLWPYAAEALDGLFRGNTTAFLSYATLANARIGFSLANPDHEAPEALRGIECADSVVRTRDLEDLLPQINEIEHQSRFLGSSGPPDPTLLCPLWRMQAKEIAVNRFGNVHTRSPILFIANTLDPVTPIVNAYESSAFFPGSVVLENEGYGHTSIAAPSICTARYVVDYFSNGSLPDPKTICNHSYKVFETPSSYLFVPGLKEALGSGAVLRSSV